MKALSLKSKTISSSSSWPTLINFFEPIVFWEIAYSKAVISLDGYKKALFPPSIILREGIEPNGTPFC